MQLLLLSSLFACVLSFHNVIARYTFTLARKGLMPTRLGAVHPRHHSPSFCSIVQTSTALVRVGACALIGLDPLVGVFGSMAGVSTVGMVLLMLTTSVAVVVFFARNPNITQGGPWQTPSPPSRPESPADRRRTPSPPRRPRPHKADPSARPSRVVPFPGRATRPRRPDPPCHGSSHTVSPRPGELDTYRRGA
ncbi:hypothetical protein ACIP2Y_43850 [Streptomyces sviceus]|uniref:hypothetical protein n=1 Tax=Streptomyces sviceus TaxID=285530 RepID=UPI0038298AA8